MKKTALCLLLTAACAAGLSAAEYEIDAGHSSVGFKVRHMVVAKTSGRFGRFSGTFDYDPKDARSWKAKATIDAASIDTGIAKRDDHLRNPDFFDVEKYPTLEFASTKVTPGKDGKHRLEGMLTMHGVTKPVVLDLEFGGSMQDPSGNERVGFSATGKLSRKDFGMTWNKALESGGFVVGDEVELAIDVEGIRKKPAGAPSQKAAAK